MNIWNVLKAGFALGFVWTWVTLAFASTAFVAMIPLIPIIGALLDVAIAPMWIALGILAVPISVAVSLKLLAWVDAGANEFSVSLHARSQFVRARNKLTRKLPKWLAEAVNLLT